uniref:Uncharacterized protein n=1 Tax=Picea sitchensis TaxID=3332 RepID=B8LNJ7_PICSI|nr:unknown [Picea sitchensis]
MWNGTKGRCCGRPPLEDHSLQERNINITLEAASIFHQAITQQEYKSTLFINSWEHFVGKSSWLYMTMVPHLSMVDLSFILERERLVFNQICRKSVLWN